MALFGDIFIGDISVHIYATKKQQTTVCIFIIQIFTISKQKQLLVENFIFFNIQTARKVLFKSLKNSIIVKQDENHLLQNREPISKMQFNSKKQF